MGTAHHRLGVTAWRWLALFLLGLAAFPPAVSAQEATLRTFSVVPSLGFGLIRVNDSWNSAGMEAALDLEYGGTAWRGNGFASVRGVGVGCSHACFEGGPALGMGVARSAGRFWLGAGAAVMKQHGEWRLSPYGRVSFEALPVRFDVRIEFPQHDGSGVYLPIVVGIPISHRWQSH